MNEPVGAMQGANEKEGGKVNWRIMGKPPGLPTHRMVRVAPISPGPCVFIYPSSQQDIMRLIN